MQFGNRKFSPRLWAILLYLIIVVLMLGLGRWQLGRAAEKVSMQVAFDSAMSADAVPIDQVDSFEQAATSYLRVSLSGHYDEDKQFLWDNRIYKGRAGYEVLVPLRLSNGQWVLINRGWVALGGSRQVLPDVSLPAEVTGQQVDLTGYLSRPSKGFAQGAALPKDGSWPRVLQFLDYQAISEALGEPTLPVLVQTQVSTAAAQPVLTDQRVEWLTGNWQPAAAGPAKHYSYAFQWFAMAFALSVLFVVVNTKRTDSESELSEQA